MDAARTWISTHGSKIACGRRWPHASDSYAVFTANRTSPVTSERWQRVRRVFEQALETPKGNRTALLNEVCGGDTELRAEVESLLQHHGRLDDSFLEPRGVKLRLEAGRSESWTQSLIGRKIGQYTVARLIGCGGMGCVFEARQERPARAVALKVLQPGFSMSAALARFRLEPEVLGLFQHPNIAQVFEAGVHEDESGAIPYFAMEYLPAAQAITDYADQHKLGIRQRVALFAAVCDAAHHAHQHGVIHRDFKPANLLVDSAGTPKVIDFGVARAINKDIVQTTITSATGLLVGTVQYMSPEQCDGDPHKIDIRSDVYSLGVVLYELLTGALPYKVEGKSACAVAVAIKEAEPYRPPLRMRGLRGDLETIVLKALEKRCERRYQSVGDLVRDLRHWLAREPIEACPPTMWVRWVRWVMRHPTTATVGICLMLAGAIIGGALVSVWYLRSRPAYFCVEPDGSAVWLASHGGSPLIRWQFASPGRNVVLAHICETTPAVRERLAVVAFSNRPLDPAVEPLSVYRVDRDYRTAYWKGTFSPENLPAVPSSGDAPLSSEAMAVHCATGADVFDDPGDELIVVHQHGGRTHSAIRVYRVDDGAVLYQIWVDASIHDVYWLSRPRLLVCAGVSGTHTWLDRGVRAIGHPAVVFAIRPVRSFCEPSYLAQEQSEWNTVNPSLAPVWYRCILPNHSVVPWQLDLAQDVWTDDHFTLSMLFLNDMSKFWQGFTGSATAPEFHWILDASGNTVGSPVAGELYQFYEASWPSNDPCSLPPIREWQMLDYLPPVTTSSTELSGP